MRTLLIVLLLPFLLISCNRSGMGIFYSISEEQPLKDTALDNSLSVTGMTEAASQYYVSAGTLFRRTAGGAPDTEWDDSVAMPDGMAFCISLVAFNTNLYGVFTSFDGTSSGIYSSPADTIAWTETAAFLGKLTSLVATSTALYLTESTDPATYVTWESTDGTNFATVTLLGQYTSVTDATIFNAETWLVSGNKIYRGTGGAPASFAPDTGAPASAAGYGGIYAFSAFNALFLSSAEGVLAATTDGTTWDQAAAVDADANPVPLYDMEEVLVATVPVLLVGAQNGYYDVVFGSKAYSSTFSLEVPGSDAAGSYSSSDANFLKIDLRSSVVRFFFVDDTENTVFACTSGNGLWINPISGADVASLTRKWDRQ